MRQFKTANVAALLFVCGLGAAASANAQTAVVAPAKASFGQGGKAGTFANSNMTISGKQRSYRVFVPASIDPQKPAPVLFAFHGLFDNKDLMALYTLLDLLAKEKNFIVVYPNGINTTWPILPEWAKEDLTFFDTMYDRIKTDYNVDLNRVYLAGMSMGAMFTHIVASQRPDKVAAIMSHSGTLGLMQFSQLRVSHKYAVLAVHGTDDFILPVSEGRKTRDAYLSWGHPVQYLEVEKGNHLWAHQIDVNHKMWDFFVKHPFE